MKTNVAQDERTWKPQVCQKVSLREALCRRVRPAATWQTRWPFLRGGVRCATSVARGSQGRTARPVAGTRTLACGRRCPRTNLVLGLAHLGSRPSQTKSTGKSTQAVADDLVAMFAGGLRHQVRVGAPYGVNHLFDLAVQKR